METKKHGAEEDIYLAPAETVPEDPETVTADVVQEEDIPIQLEDGPKPKVRVGEILELREENRKVFRMSDGTQQAVFFPEAVHAFNEESQTYDEIDGILTEDADEKHYVGGKGRFTARFSREQDNDELFVIEKGMHRVTVLAKKNKKQKNKGVTPRLRKQDAGQFAQKDVLTFEGVEAGSDYEYSITGNGVKENIIVKERSDVYRYPFVLRCENVTAQLDEKNKRVAFVSNETGEEVFFIPSPFMTDANGATSAAVSYAFRTDANGDAMLAVTADSEWLNAKSRAFPVVIDPQIQLSGSAGMSTYSWDSGYLYSAAQHTVGTVSTTCEDDCCCSGENMKTAIELSFNALRRGSIDVSGDEVWYKFTANAEDAHVDGGTGSYTIYTEGSMDAIGSLFDSNGNEIAYDDDAGSSLNFSITAQLNYGQTYYIRVKAYGSKTGSYCVAVTHANAAGTNTRTVGCYATNRMYLSFRMPTLPRNPRIKKAELTFFQAMGTVESTQHAKLGLYQVDDEICTGYCTPCSDANLLDYAVMQSGGAECGDVVSYTFDVTTLVDKINKGEDYRPRLVLKMVDENYNGDNHVALYGSAQGGSYAPQFSVTYESTYGVNTSYRTHTHELGRFGQGSIDLQCGNLMFESEDFSWAGNRMPVTIRHLYNSALCAYQYTGNSGIKLNTAYFGAMHLGYGFKLNLMQSMVETGFYHKDTYFYGYVYTGENSEEIYFKESEQAVCCDSNGQCYKLYEAVADSEMLYDPVKLTLTQGEDTYLFDTRGRLIRITDGNGNQMDITYTANRITSVTDGAGRDFDFVYNSSGFLSSIIAPDNTSILYTYSGNLLTTVTYPDGKKVKLSYSGSKPYKVILLDANGDNVYRVDYTYSGNRLYRVQEYGVKNGSFVQGNQSMYSYSVASGRTIVQTIEQMDLDEGDCHDNVIKTVYTFDDDGNIVSEYVYSEDTGNTGVEGEASGIHPYAGDGGAGIVSNINNLLMGHNFENLNYWSEMDANCGGVHIRNYVYEPYVKFGKKLLRIESFTADCKENGMYQTTNMLPMGQYTFSAYLRVPPTFSGSQTAGAYIRVTTTNGTVLAESEHICNSGSDYVRLCAPFVLTAAQSVVVQILVDGKGTVYADGAQLENNPYANAYNMLENGSFERDASWTSHGASYTAGTRFNMGRSLMMTGNLEETRFAYQTVTVKTQKTTRETFTLSGWAKGYGLPNHDREGANAPTFRLRAVVNYSDTVAGESNFETFTADFSPCTEEWQFASVQFAKSKYRTVRDIYVYCDYDYNTGTVYFDAVQLVRDSLEMGLTAEDFIEEDIDDTTATTDENEATVAEDTVPSFEEAKDAFGNALTETTFTEGEFGTIYRAFAYNTDPDGSGNAGNDLVMETDARGNTTAYTVDEDTSRNEEVTDRCGNKTAYEYDASGRTTKVTSKAADGVELANVSYAYDAFDNLTQIVRGDGMKYVLAYNAYHNLESIGVDGEDEKLVQHTYKTGNGRLKGITYANGDAMAVTYNSAGQMTAEKWFDKDGKTTAHYKYVYDGQGNIVRSIDMTAEKEYTYSYEEGRLTRAAECVITDVQGEIITGKTLVNTIFYVYDGEGTLIRKRILPAEGEERVIYYETADNNTVVKFSAGGKTVTSHSKTDSFGRKAFDELQLGTGFMFRQFSYHAGDVTEKHKEKAKLCSSPTTQLVSQIVLSDGRTISYEYDAEERITKVTDSVEGVTAYTYDAMGQLLTETVDGTVVNTMTYDNYGNILQKNGKVYTYGNAAWKDLLTSYNGQAISYDAQGNPLNYLGHTLTWEKGRQLKSFDGIAYTYNANGIRTSKTVGGVPHEYLLDGVTILRETWGGNILDPLYDNEDTVCGIVYNGVPYYFHKNLQGDIIAIADQNGKVVARYTYDAWGKCEISPTSTNAAIAEINPYRYRGYYFDTETGFYYLQSRYYDPTVGRFINADKTEYSVMDKNIMAGNLYTYCYNQPVNETDYNGTLIGKVFKKIIVGVLKGLFQQFCIDVIEWAFKRFILGKKDAFTTSRAEDYCSTALSAIFDEFKLSNIVGMAASVVCLLVKYLPKLFAGRMEKKDWGNLLIDVMSILVKAAIGKLRNNLKTKRNRLLKKQFKTEMVNVYKKTIRKLGIKIRHLGFTINVTIPISQQVFSSAVNILFG